MKLKVNEIFETIQGEGVFTGVPAVFIRLQGCPVGCAWCDTKQTWEVHSDQQIPFIDITNKRVESDTWGEVSVQDLILFYQKHYSAKHIVITGGEPCIYDLQSLTQTFEAIGCQCQIETSGTFPVKASKNTWVTVSPKIAMKGKLKLDASALARANEIKHPVGSEKDIDNLYSLLEVHEISSQTIIALQPISQKPRATALCIEQCIKNNWRLSIQTHKYLNIA